MSKEKENAARPSGLIHVKLPCRLDIGISTAQVHSRPHERQLASCPLSAPGLGPLAFLLLEKALFTEPRTSQASPSGPATPAFDPQTLGDCRCQGLAESPAC